MSTNPLEGEPLALYQSSRSILTHYEPGSKSFFHNFTPGYPPYPPHGVSYKYFNKSARRTRGLLWSRDGRSWNRRHVVASGEHDLPGTSFHFFGFIHPAGHMESDTREHLCPGAVLRYNLTQTQFQDGVWSRDMIHWGRFGKSRMSHLQNGPVGTFDAGFANHVSGYYSMPDAHGEKTCWFPYLGNQARYMLVAARDTFKKLRVGRHDVGLDVFRESYPHFRLALFFTNWEDLFRESQASVWLPTRSGPMQGREAGPCRAQRRQRRVHDSSPGSGGQSAPHQRSDREPRRCPDGSARRQRKRLSRSGVGWIGSLVRRFRGAYCPVEGASLQEVYGTVVRLRVVLDRARVYDFVLTTPF